LFLVPCRDGRVYALPDSTEVTQIASRVLRGGQIGHPGARCLVTERSVVIASFDGEVRSVGRSDWETRWSTSVEAPILAGCALGGDHVAIGDEDGNVRFLDGSTGRVVATVNLGFPIEGLVHRGDVLVARDRAHRLTVLELPSLAILEARTYPEEIAAILPDGSVLLVDGLHSAVGGSTVRPAPGTPVLERRGRVTYGSTDGRWVIIEGAEWQVAPAPAVLSCPPLVLQDGHSAYLGGRDRRVYCTDRLGTVLWSIEVESPVVDLLETGSGDILALLENGRLLRLEGNRE